MIFQKILRRLNSTIRWTMVQQLQEMQQFQKKEQEAIRSSGKDNRAADQDDFPYAVPSFQQYP